MHKFQGNKKRAEQVRKVRLQTAECVCAFVSSGGV